MDAVVCLRAQSSACARKITFDCIVYLCCVFFFARFAFFSKVCVHLKHVYLLASILLRLCVVGLVGVAPFCSRFPPLNLTFRHCI